MNIAKSIFGLIGTAILGLLATYITIPEWVLMNLERHFLQTVWGFLISAALGGAAVFIVYSTYISWKLGRKPCKAFDDLKGIDGLDDCESLADMAERIMKRAGGADEIASLKEDRISLQKQLSTANDYWKSQIARTRADVSAKNAELEREKTVHAGEIAAKDAEIASLKSDKQPKYKIPSTDLVMQMSPVVASRVYRAYRRGAYIPLNEIEPCAINSIGGRDGLFEYRVLVNPFGQRLEAKEYGLSRKWMAFLDEPAHLAQLKTVAAGWLSPEE